MSGTAWRYFVPYEPDFQHALDQLRQKAFDRGAYFQPWTDRGGPIVAPPADIAEAVARCGSAGTHSILDVVAFSLLPGAGLAHLVGEAEATRVFGTPQPSREDVDDHKFALVHHLDNGQARVMVVYESGLPDALYFEGLTGSLG